MMLTLVTNSARPQTPDYGFTSHDLIALTCWMQRADGHGYRRMLIERGSKTDGPAQGGFVLIYAPGTEWATWGLARSAEAIVVWRCSDGADLGRFPSMMLALEQLPPVLTQTTPTRKMARLSKPLRHVPRFSESQSV